MGNYGDIIRGAAGGRSVPAFNSVNFNASVKSAATAFTGGINLNVLPTSVLDEQSPDMLNMWYKDGMLRTRPGIIAKTGVTDKSKATVTNDLMIKVLNVDPIHIPTIFTNCNSRGGGNAYEDRNIIQPRVKMSFTPSKGDKTFKLADANIDDEDIKIYYHCPERVLPENYIIPKGSTYKTFQNPISHWYYEIDIDKASGLITWHRNNSLTYQDYFPNWPGFTDSATYNVIDELTFEYAKDLSADYVSGNPISGCTIAQWYGGSLSGLGNGNCLVVSGNPLYPNKYWWSAMDDISYWPVNNFNSCGDKDEAITALAKQSNYLIAFTANKTYKITYNSEIPTSSDVPYEEFPRSLLHSTIGCDCPDTIELVDNCLTWLNSDGNVYRLVTINNTVETAIVPISQNIGKAIKALTTAQLQAATACDTGRYYIIFANTKAFAWDYDSVSFINYTSTERAQDRLIWFLWGMPAVYTDAFYDGNIELNSGAFGMDETLGSDLGATFSAYVYTKKFDFGALLYWKSVYRQSFRVLSDDGNITLKVVDNYGEIDLSQTITVSVLPQIVESRQTSMTDYYQGYISRPANSTAKFAVSEFIALAQIAAQM